MAPISRTSNPANPAGGWIGSTASLVGAEHVQGRALADLIEILGEPALRGLDAELVEIAEKPPVGVELARAAELTHGVLGLDQMEVDARKAGQGGVSLLDHARHGRDAVHLADQRGVEADLGDAV